MRIAVSILAVVFPDTPGYDLLKQSDDIILHTFIPILLNHNGRCRSLCVYMHEAVLYPAAAYTLGYSIGDIDKFFSLSCPKGD